MAKYYICWCIAIFSFVLSMFILLLDNKDKERIKQQKKEQELEIYIECYEKTKDIEWCKYLTSKLE